MKRACVIGWPIAHSRSPLIHGHWLKTYGLDGSYTKVAVKPDDLDAFLQQLAVNGLSGCNVTVPHKERALARASHRDSSAVAIGAANTLWLDGGDLYAANTDTYGFIANLDDRAREWRECDGPVSVLGAGGTARAVIFGLLQAGVSEVRLVARNTGNADIVARHFGKHVVVSAWADRNIACAGCRLIVNTTTLGMNGVGSPDIDFAQSGARCVVADAVYVPLETPFLRAARGAGLRIVDGLGMLLHQAVPGFEKWFGLRPAVTEELRALIETDIRAHV